MKKNFADYHGKKKVVKKVVKKTKVTGTGIGSLRKEILVDLDFYFKKFFTSEELQSFEYDRTSSEPKKNLIADLRMYRIEIIKTYKLDSAFVKNELTWVVLNDLVNALDPEYYFRDLLGRCESELAAANERLPMKPMSANDYLPEDLEEIAIQGG